MRGLRGASFVRSFPVIFFFISYVFRIEQAIRLPIWQAKRAPYSCAVKAVHLLLMTCAATLNAQAVRVAVPPSGKLYHGLYWGGVGTDEHDPTEHDVTPNDVARYEQARWQTNRVDLFREQLVRVAEISGCDVQLDP